VLLEAISLLDQQPADALDLDFQAKQAHWNVKGPNLIGLQEQVERIR